MFSRHIRSNVVGYVALFFAFTGSAVALQGKHTVKAKDIATGAVTAPKIRSDAVTAGKLSQGSVGASAIAANAVGAGEIAGGAVGTAELASGAVTAANIAASAITGAQLNKTSLGLGPESFGQMPALRVAGVITQTAPAITPTDVQLDTGNVIVNTGDFGVTAAAATVPRSGIYYVRLFVPWGEDPDAADRQFVAQLTAGGELVGTGTERATQNVGFNYGPATESAGIVELDGGDQLTGEVYYSGTTPTGQIPLAGFGLTTLEAFWIGPS